MGNTLGCSVFCARPSVPTSKKCLTKNNLENHKKNWLRKRRKILKTVGKSSTFTESTPRQQVADVNEDTKYQEFLEKSFIVKAYEGHTQDESDSEFNNDILPLHDGYMKASDFRRFVEENFNKWEKKKSCTQHQAEFTDSVEECKQPDAVRGYIETDQNDAITTKVEEVSNCRSRRNSTNETTGDDTNAIGENDNKLPTEEKKKTNALDGNNSSTVHGRNMFDSILNGNENVRHEKNSGEPMRIFYRNDEIYKVHSCIDISNGNWSSFKNKLENCDQDYIRQSTNAQSNNVRLGRGLNLEHWYMSVASYANSAKNYTISHLRMEDKKLYFTSMSLPNLSDIRYNPEHQSKHMTKSVLFETAEVYNSSLSDISTYEAEESPQHTDEHKRNTPIISRTDSSTDSGRSSNVTDLSTTGSKRVRSGYTRNLCNPDCALCRAAQIEYMIEVYEPLIVRQIRVTDILEFLPLIDEKNKEMLRSKHCQSPHEAMEMLLKVIKKSDAPGKWQSFLDAIYKTEFTYMSMLLNDETEIQYNYSTAVLSLIRPEIRNRMYLPDFLDKVFEKELLTEAEKDEAISLPKGAAAQTYILDRIDKHLPNWDNVFIEVLNESCMSDLADLFILVSQKDTLNSELSVPAKGRNDRNRLKRTVRKHRLQLIEKAHRRPYAESSEHHVTGIYGLPKESMRDLATTAKQEGAKYSGERKMKQESLLQTIASEQTELKTEFKHLQRTIFDQVKGLKDEIIELRVCVNILLKSNDSKGEQVV